MRYAILFLWSFAAVADVGDGLYPDPLAGIHPVDPVTSVAPIYDRYAPAPVVVAPIPPGQGTSYYSKDQVMTDHQSCYHSSATGAWVCQGH